MGGMGHCSPHLKIPFCCSMESCCNHRLQAVPHPFPTMTWRKQKVCLDVKCFHGQKNISINHQNLGIKGFWNKAKLALNWAWAVCTVNTNRSWERKLDSSCSSSSVCTVRQAENGDFLPKSWCIAFRGTGSSGPKMTVSEDWGCSINTVGTFSQ